MLLAAIRCGKGEVEQNLAAHVRLLAKAARDGCDLVLFPEMSLTGSVDPATHPERLMAADGAAVSRLAGAAGQAGVAACFGIAERGADGRPYITQLLADGGQVPGVQRKRYLGEGEESFAGASGAASFACAGTRVGVAICAEAGFDEPFDAVAAAGGKLVLFPAAPGLYGRRTDEASWRAGFSWWQGSSLGDAARHARRLGLWVALAGQAGSADDEDFPGLAALVSPDGNVVAQLPDWREGTLAADIPL